MSKRTERAGHQLELEANNLDANGTSRTITRREMNEYELDAIGAEKLVNQSHLPDLVERLIETHRLLQMSRDYLMPMAVNNRAFNHACDNILDAMGNIELAIAKLQQP